MRHNVFTALLAASIALSPLSAAAERPGPYVVSGVEETDMLKMRAGPGVGYNVLVGLPNGTEVRLIKCESVGGKRWCQVSLKIARGLRGWVSYTYLRKLN